MSILNSFDMQMMENDVCDIISGWQLTVVILRPKPTQEQPNYNKIMREFTGPIIVDQMTVPAERKDITNYLLTNVRSNIAGLIADGDQLYALPASYIDEYGDRVQLRISHDDIFVLPSEQNNKFSVKAIKDRIGEQLVLLHRYVGGTISGW